MENYTTIVYDGSLDGLFTAIYENYEYKIFNGRIVDAAFYQPLLIGDVHHVITQEDKAARVFKKLTEIGGQNLLATILSVYLSEDVRAANLIFNVVKKVILHRNIQFLKDYSDNDILVISKLMKSINRERHRMTAFVRFELMDDHTFFAVIDPDFDVLPLIKGHFSRRYKDQKWMIYDKRRKYALYYDLFSIEMYYNIDDIGTPVSIHEQEKSYQTLWQTYFRKTNITERKNDKLHIRHVPKRYWKYLTEKKV